MKKVSHTITMLSLVASSSFATIFALLPCIAVADSRPNIILVLIDDCSADELSCYGNQKHHTPTLDRLAETGARFETCWATPLCSPSRALIMTGRYGFRTGWFSNKMRKETPLTRDNICFAQLLQKAGYRTAVAGKWQLPGLPPEYGFDQWSLWVCNSLLPEDVEHEGVETTNPKSYNYMWPARYWYPGIIQDGEYLPTTIEDYGPDIHSQFLIDFMLKDSDKPFFTYYPMILTHDPFFPSPDTVESDDQKSGASNQGRHFKSNIEYLDKIISSILTHLDKKELLHNTAIIITGDNGTLGRGKGATKEIGVREPLIVSWPDQISNGGVRRELVDFSDIFPTLMDMAKARIPSDYIHDGRSFLPLLQGGSYNEREFIFSYKDDHQLVRDKRWLLEGDGRFFDCGDNRDPRGYKLYGEVTDSTEPEVMKAKKRFEMYLSDKPKGAWNRVKKKTTGVGRK